MRIFKLITNYLLGIFINGIIRPAIITQAELSQAVDIYDGSQNYRNSLWTQGNFFLSIC